jgi:hypothetical protein
MKTAIEAIKNLSGISCVFYFDPHNGILAQKSTPGFTEKDLSSVGRTLEKIYSWGTDIFSDVSQISLQYNEFAILVKKAADRRYLIIIHEQTVDPNVLNIAVVQALKAPIKKLSSAYAPRRTGAVAQSGATAAASKGVYAKSASPILTSLGNALNKVMGPMASIVFDDACQACLDNIDHPSVASIENLINTLCAEISDSEKVKVFRKLIAPHLKS